MSAVYPQVDLEEWCKTHKLEVRTNNCLKCGVEQRTTIPWASKNWRGLMAPIHECGIEYQLSTAANADPKERAEWSAMANAAKNGVFD